MKNVFIAIASCFLVLSGCDGDDLIEISDNHKSTETSISLMGEFLSTYDVIDEVLSLEDILTIQNESILPLGTTVTYLDSSLTDGDGVEVLLDFGSLGSSPKGLLCRDHKYRAGRITLSLDERFPSNNSAILVSMDNERPFYSGNGNEMIMFKGSFTIMHKNVANNKLSCEDLNLVCGDIALEVFSMLDVHAVRRNSPQDTDDYVTFHGELLLTDRHQETTKFIIKKPLCKQSSFDCLKYITSGKMDIQKSSTISEIVVDFDPHERGVCDNLISITTNGKELFTHY